MFRAGSSTAIATLRFGRGLATHASQSTASARKPTRHDWAKTEIKDIYDSPLLDLVYRAASVHRQHHDPGKIQLCTLMNIKSTYPISCARQIPRSRGDNCSSHFLTMKVFFPSSHIAGGCTEDCEYFPRSCVLRDKGRLCSDRSSSPSPGYQVPTARNLHATRRQRRHRAWWTSSPF